METNIQNKLEVNLENMVTGLKHEDSRNLRLTTNFMWLMWIMSPLYLLFAIILSISEKPNLVMVGFLFFSAGFFSFGLLFKSLNVEYKAVDYGISTIDMLKKAVKRYRFWQAKTYLTILPCILICFATSFSIEHLIPYPDQLTRMIIVFVGCFLILCLALFIGYLVWRIRKKPMQDKAMELLAEIEK